MVIVNRSRVHQLEVRCCGCPDAMSPDIQMFRHGLFAASFNRPKTLFTFSVLNDFLLDNLECGTSAMAMNYYNKLRQVTSSTFPHLVLLMRVSRQWQHLKNMKWHGFSHHSNHRKPGDLALFCLACPQPGINLSLTTEESLDDWKYTRSFMMDGNFKVEHLHPINLDDEVWLSDGFGFMVGKDRYQRHLALESTGIRGGGGVACTRHGCFVPHLIVDFQKGKRFSDERFQFSQDDSHEKDALLEIQKGEV
ncbi:uncharacterized protein EDB91DRAFT_1240275 [Suillus paluster]|uniref:uncharacterized protein n=1 Tax=Suillus paluster TaxID=48578 RepID=UPI001B8695DE|nr:uncharacterized protein EDB91DRAFT_1240275 [Suillus paluster]KAG1721824.1 hypothetical protein EDB91DRAFT_1240275 [Suillus paluster]